MTYEHEPVSAIGSPRRVSPNIGQELLKQRNEERRKEMQTQAAGVKRTANTTPKWVEALTMRHAVKKYSCYMIFVETVKHLSLDKLQNQMMCEANLMNTEHAIQQNLVTLSSLFTYLKGHAFSDGAAYGKAVIGNALPHDGEYNPNAFNGLDRFNSAANTGYGFGNTQSDFNKEYVGKDYQTVVLAFEKAFKNIFYANNDTDTLKYEDASHIDNPNLFPTGKGFDLSGKSGLWATLDSKYSKYNLEGQHIFATQKGQHISLIQQYCYYKAQAATYVDSKAHVNSANGDISKLVNFDITDKKCDPVIKSVMAIVSDLDKPLQVTRGAGYTPQFAETTESGAKLILDNMLYVHKGGSASASGEEMGVYGYFSCAAFNYFWLKNPTSTKAFPAGLSPNIDGNPMNHWVAANESGASLTDELSTLDDSVNGNEKNLGQSVGEGSVTIQSVTTNEGQDVNIVQTGLKGKKEADSTMLQNQKT